MQQQASPQQEPWSSLSLTGVSLHFRQSQFDGASALASELFLDQRELRIFFKFPANSHEVRATSPPASLPFALSATKGGFVLCASSVLLGPAACGPETCACTPITALRRGEWVRSCANMTEMLARGLCPGLRRAGL